MQTFVLVVHIILAIMMIVLILVQHGKGADAGASLAAAAQRLYSALPVRLTF